MAPPPEDLGCFEDNWQSFQVFQRLVTQWERAGERAQPTGLRYASLPVVMRRCKVTRADFDRVFDDVQLMEIETLEAIQERSS